MDANTTPKKRLPGRHVTEGPARAPDRSYYYYHDAMGKFCATAGDEVVELVRLNLRPCMSVTRKAPGNAAAAVAESGRATNATLHLLAIAHECGIACDLFDVAEVFKRTPYIADLKPAGRFVAKDLFEAGGVPLLMKTLLDNGFMHDNCMTVTGYGMAENLTRVALSSEFEKRWAAWQPRGSAFGSGYVWKYAQQVGSARHGAVTHPGEAAEKACYADI